jgi:SAM-dependent methyltransferase
MGTRFYKFAYRVGFTPWESADLERPVAEQISAMFDREESERQPPYGQALDLGCGSGPHAVALASRGWQVTGIDIVPKALQIARERAREAGVKVRFVQGDVTALRAAGVGSGFRLVLDFGTVHGLKDARRQAVGREVSAVAAPDATLLIFTFSPGRRGPIARGMSRKDIEAAFPTWKVTDEEAYALDIQLPPFVTRADPRWYRLRRDPPTRQT